MLVSRSVVVANCDNNDSSGKKSRPKSNSSIDIEAICVGVL